MKASRLKTIVIVILLLVNAFLLFLLLSRRAEQTQAYERTVEQLCELFERSGVSFDRALLPENSDVYALSPERSSTREMAFAKSLLGDDVSAFDSGGGISRSRIKMDISDQRSRIPLFIQLFTNLAQVSGFPFPLCRKTHILSSRLDHTDRLSYRRLRIHR